MKVSAAKENILKKIRQALTHSTPLPFPGSEGNSSLYNPATQELDIEFAEQFAKLQGKFIFCLNHKELVSQLNGLISHNDWKNIYCREKLLQGVLSREGFNKYPHEGLAECVVTKQPRGLLLRRTGSIVMSTA